MERILETIASQGDTVSFGSVDFKAQVALMGECGVLKISASELLRLRWNLFYSDMEDLSFEFMKLKDH
jgi:hypothetical protein